MLRGIAPDHADGGARGHWPRLKSMASRGNRGRSRRLHVQGEAIRGQFVLDGFDNLPRLCETQRGHEVVEDLLCGQVSDEAWEPLSDAVGPIHGLPVAPGHPVQVVEDDGGRGHQVQPATGRLEVADEHLHRRGPRSCPAGFVLLPGDSYSSRLTEGGISRS